MKRWFRNVWAAIFGRAVIDTETAVDVGRVIDARVRAERAAQQSVDARIAVASEFPSFIEALEAVRVALDQVPSKINVTLTGTSEPYAAMKKWVDSATESHVKLREERERMAQRERELLNRWTAQVTDQRKTIERLAALVEKAVIPVGVLNVAPSGLTLTDEEKEAWREIRMNKRCKDLFATAGSSFALSATQPLAAGDVVSTSGRRMPGLDEVLTGHPHRPSSEAVLNQQQFESGHYFDTKGGTIREIVTNNPPTGTGGTGPSS